ncbi:YjbQ family protein [Paenibacillus illinoisensis]|uniref:YjbQ family protein n=1 Tax=Paenibacillus illinoisensis TaxID=59845 RepID=UPI0012B980B0|nr:YjbQ family protein [Paenibacillus xylanexedens]
MLKEIKLASKGFDHAYDITEQIEGCLGEMERGSGIAHVCAVGSTIGLTVMRYEPGAVQDLLQMLNEIAPHEKKVEYHHFRTTGDMNGSSHIKSSILGTSLSLPVSNYKLAMSATHRVVLFDFDLQEATRTLFIDL